MSNVLRSRHLALWLVFPLVHSIHAPDAWAAWGADPKVNFPVCTAANAQDASVSVSDSEGGAIIVWHDETNNGGDIHAQRVSPSGLAMWLPDGAWLVEGNGGQSWPIAIADGMGGAIAAWEDRRSGAATVYAQRIDRDGQVQWTPNGVFVSRCEGGPFKLQIVPDGASGAIVVWMENRFGVYGVYAQHLNSAGVPQWISTGVPASSASITPVELQAATDGQGGAIVVWTDPSAHTLTAQHIDDSGAVQWSSLGSTIQSNTSYSNPDVLGDGAGGAYVTYAYGSPSHQIKVVRLAAANGFPSWQVVLDTSVNSSTVPLQRVVPSVGGDVIVGWTLTRPGFQSVIGAQRLSPDGVKQWNALGVVLASDQPQQMDVVADGTGGALFVWPPQRDTVNVDPLIMILDIYGSRVDSNGTPWPHEVLICHAPNQQSGPTVVPDGQGGGIFTWDDDRAGYGLTDIYAQRVFNDGTLAPDLTAVPPKVEGDIRVSVAPNPAGSEGVTIRFALPRADAIRVRTFDAAGREMAELESGNRPAGAQQVQWDGRDAHGGVVPAGLYFLRVDYGGRTVTKRIALAR